MISKLTALEGDGRSATVWRSVIQGWASAPSLFPKGPWSTAPQAQGSDDAGKDIKGPLRVTPPSTRPSLCSLRCPIQSIYQLRVGCWFLFFL